MLVKDNYSQCSGCGLCAVSCTRKAISFVKKVDGFLYPEINASLCNNCGLCKIICPFDNSYCSKNTTIDSYALKHSDSVRNNSSSGGFFTAISDYFIDNGGVVYGAVWTKDFGVKHIRTESKVERDKMRGSKYVQSDLMGVFDLLKEDVKNRKTVLFTGTPCQCAAVVKLFGKNKPGNLIIMDLICHGVLSQTLFDEYINDIKRKFPKKIIGNINLRDKRFGLQVVGIDFIDGYTYQDDKDYFYKIYSMNGLQRESCFSCTCAKETRFGDFTVGDFWGLQNSYPEFYDALGVSLVLVNTQEGKELFDKISTSLDVKKVNREDYISFQPNLSKATAKGERAERFKKYYVKHGYNKTMHRFFDVTLMRKINSFGAKILRKVLKK